MADSGGSRLATVECPPVTALPRDVPDATTHQARCAKRSARSPPIADGSGANCAEFLSTWPIPALATIKYTPMQAVALQAIRTPWRTIWRTPPVSFAMRTFTRSAGTNPVATAVHAFSPRKTASANPRASGPPVGLAPRRCASSVRCDGSRRGSPAMADSGGSRLATVECPPVTALPRDVPDATTHQARCAKRSARSPPISDGSPAEASTILASLPPSPSNSGPSPALNSQSCGLATAFPR